MTIYPNPVNDRFNIQTRHKIETVKIYNLLSKLLKSYQLQNTYSAFGLQSGVYFINIYCSDEMFTQIIFIE